MKNNIKIAMLGGDMRQLAVAKSLSLSYDDIRLWGISGASLYGADGISLYSDITGALEDARFAVLPLPASTDGVSLNCPLLDGGERPKLSEIARRLSKDTAIIGGRIPDSFRCLAESEGIKVFDYFESEDFQVKNAYTTAEAAVSIAMNTLDRNIRGAKIAITGYGRISKHLCSLLAAIGADVTVAARKSSDIAWAESSGYKTVRILPNANSLSVLQVGYDVIYNTVPHWLFDRDFLARVDKNTFIVDLASAPGGVDICAAKELGSNVSWATSLPGKYATRSAGELIAECVDRIIGEEAAL